MINLAGVDINGQPLFTMVVEQKPADTNEVIYVEMPKKVTPERLLSEYVFHKNKWKNRGARPSEFHVWEVSSSKWILSKERIADSLIREVNKLRIKKLQEPILIDDFLVDIKANSISNIDMKIFELKAKIERGVEISLESLFWRGSLNQEIRFESADGFLKWLELVKIKASERLTDIYSWSWLHKRNIQLMVDANDDDGLVNYFSKLVSHE